MRDRKKDERIEIFNSIRDIPYRIPLGVDEEDNCCNGKHRKLQALFKKAGYASAPWMCKFHWSKLNLPREILAIPHDDLANHVYLRVAIHSDRGEIIDASWDYGLRDILPVNTWDGDSHTMLAVPQEPTTAREQLDFFKNDNPMALLEALKTNGEFFQALNQWLEKNRK